MTAHSGQRAARRYLDVVEQAWSVERNLGDRSEFSQAVARGLHRFMAYKDEYEVARLLTDESQVRALHAQLPGAARMKYNLHPPVLRAAGLGRKIALGPAWRPVMRTLAKGRALRGTPVDPFGFARVRRVERALVEDYAVLVEGLCVNLSLATYDDAVELAELAELVRGYEDIKLENVRRYVRRRAELAQPVSVQLAKLLG
jgi:indolepyruvate ferredoxin oxidoreductase